jgi:hypothetical protein
MFSSLSHIYFIDLIWFDWIGLDWIGLDWIGLDWIGLDWIGLDWIGLDWIGLDMIGLIWFDFICYFVLFYSILLHFIVLYIYPIKCSASNGTWAGKKIFNNPSTLQDAIKSSLSYLPDLVSHWERMREWDNDNEIMR